MTATECPICTHTPFSADMCVPAKGLQMTIKAFIKTERKKRGAEAAAPAGEPVAATPAEPMETPDPAIAAPADTESAAVAGSEEGNAAMTETGQDGAAKAAEPANEVSDIPLHFSLHFPLQVRDLGMETGMRLGNVSGCMGSE